MSFASLTRLSALLVFTAFAAGCAQEEAEEFKAKVPVVESEGDDGKATTPGSKTSSASDNGGVAKPVTPATTTPAAPKPAAKPAIACATDVDSVTQSYFIALQRKPDEGGLQSWVGKIQNGNTRLGVLKEILQSPEFIAGREQLTNDEYVTSLYRSFFDRDPDAGIAFWVDQLNKGGSRSGVAIGFADSDEFKSASNRAVACYF